MKIGILTVYFADYGSYFHATSLYNYLERQGHECELIHESIRYRTSKMLAISSIFEKIAPKFLKKLFGHKITALNTYILLKEDLKQYRISPKCKSIKEIESRYDCIIIGSDELWSSTNKTIRFIPEYFGIGISKPHFSYSTSGITLKFPNKMEGDIKEGLMTFEKIAVRDSVTADWVQKLTDREVEIVLDPALLYPYYKALSNRAIGDKKYIIVYGEHFSQTQIEWIIRYALYRNLELYSIAWKHAWCNMHYEIHSAAELQNAFAGAVHCMSSTFHGTIFAIINNVPFTAFLSELRGQKLKLLVEGINLSNCIYSDGLDAAVDVKIDYKEVHEIIEEKRKISEIYLLDALSKVAGRA